jgi:hypothetical protein
LISLKVYEEIIYVNLRIVKGERHRAVARKQTTDSRGQKGRAPQYHLPELPQ